MNYIRQTYREMREQPLASWLSVAGTTLSIFLLMTVFTVNNIRNSRVAPETRQDMILVGEGIHLTDTVGYESSSSCLSKEWTEKLYGGLEGVERISYSSSYPSDIDICIPGKPAEEYAMRETDHEYWNIFDFKFLEGKPFSKAESDAEVNIAILTEKTARDIFGKADVTGSEILLGHVPYRVTGVVATGSPLLTMSYADVYVPIKNGPELQDSWMSEYMGNCNAFILKKPGVSDDEIKRQVEKRYSMVQGSLRKEGRDMVYHGSPYNADEMAVPHGSNTSPDTSSNRRTRLTIYAILILLPAINLSGMTNSRLRRRVSEIGVRRAFGATRAGIIGQLLTENMIVTILGGLAGLFLSFIFLYFFSSLFVDMSANMLMTESVATANPTFGMMFTWSGFWTALLFCLILNLASAGIPVWKASGTDPAEAISGNENGNR